MGSEKPGTRERIRQLASALDRMDYFRLLKLRSDATPIEIRDAYHKMARNLHPDRYQYLGREDLQQDLVAITRRLSEAYQVLRDDTKRQRYVSGLETDGKLRYTHEDDRAAQEEENEAAMGRSPQGRKLSLEAREHHAAGRTAEAIKALKMALVYESGNEILEGLLRKWEGK